MIHGETAGQSIKQSTMMKQSLPAWVQKSIAISWNGLFGLGFCMNGSLTLEGIQSWHI